MLRSASQVKRMTESNHNGSSKRSVGPIFGGILALILLVGGIFTYPTAQKAWKIAHPVPQNLSLDESLISNSSTTAKTIESRLKNQLDLKTLREEFEAQQYLSYCGVASSVMVLRSLGDKDVSQDNFFSDATQKVHSRYETFFGGMTLKQLGGLLNAHGVKANVFHADDSSLEEFRRHTRQNLEEPNNFVLINYLRRAIKQKSGGHISPIAAYDDVSDRFLVMDVAAHKYPPVWVKAEDLWKSLNTVDSDSGRTRGYVLVEKAK